eukprot:COSAG06_NODE_24032_length_674_cov_4.965071_1_plen_159_part_00
MSLLLRGLLLAAVAVSLPSGTASPPPPPPPPPPRLDSPYGAWAAAPRSPTTSRFTLHRAQPGPETEEGREKRNPVPGQKEQQPCRGTKRESGESGEERRKNTKQEERREEVRKREKRDKKVGRLLLQGVGRSLQKEIGERERYSAPGLEGGSPASPLG